MRTLLKMTTLSGAALLLSASPAMSASVNIPLSQVDAAIVDCLTGDIGFLADLSRQANQIDPSFDSITSNPGSFKTSIERDPELSPSSLFGQCTDSNSYTLGYTSRIERSNGKTSYRVDFSYDAVVSVHISSGGQSLSFWPITTDNSVAHIDLFENGPTCTPQEYDGLSRPVPRDPRAIALTVATPLPQYKTVRFKGVDGQVSALTLDYTKLTSCLKARLGGN